MENNLRMTAPTTKVVRFLLQEYAIEYLKSELEKMSELLKNENLPQEEREKLLKRQKIFKKQLKKSYRIN